MNIIKQDKLLSAVVKGTHIQSTNRQKHAHTQSHNIISVPTKCRDVIAGKDVHQLRV